MKKLNKRSLHSSKRQSLSLHVSSGRLLPASPNLSQVLVVKRDILIHFMSSSTEKDQSHNKTQLSSDFWHQTHNSGFLFRIWGKKKKSELNKYI